MRHEKGEEKLQPPTLNHGTTQAGEHRVGTKAPAAHGSAGRYIMQGDVEQYSRKFSKSLDQVSHPGSSLDAHGS